MSDEVCYTLPELAKVLRVCHKTIYNMANAGELPSFKCGGWRFPVKAINEWIATQAEGRK